MGLFKQYLIAFFLFSFFFCSISNQDKINNFSFLDYSHLSSHEFQLNIGYQNNNNIYFSVDKIISHNLIGSVKLSKLNSTNIKFFNQNTLLFISDKSFLNFIFCFNYLVEHSEVDKWLNTGLIFDLTQNKKFIPSLGIYYDFISLDDLSGNKLNYFLSLKSRIKNNFSLMMGLAWKPVTKVLNYNIEMNLEI